MVMRINSVNDEKFMVKGEECEDVYTFVSNDLGAKGTISVGADDDIMCRLGKAKAAFEKVMKPKQPTE